MCKVLCRFLPGFTTAPVGATAVVVSVDYARLSIFYCCRCFTCNGLSSFLIGLILARSSS